MLIKTIFKNGLRATLLADSTCLLYSGLDTTENLVCISNRAQYSGMGRLERNCRPLSHTNALDTLNLVMMFLHMNAWACLSIIEKSGSVGGNGPRRSILHFSNGRMAWIVVIGVVGALGMSELSWVDKRDTSLLVHMHPLSGLTSSNRLWGLFLL